MAQMTELVKLSPRQKQYLIQWKFSAQPTVGTNYWPEKNFIRNFTLVINFCCRYNYLPNQWALKQAALLVSRRK